MTNYRLHMLRTLNSKRSEKDQLLNVTLGLAGEAGEFADLVKKYAFHDHPLNREKLIDELGDIRWYLEAATYLLGTTTEAVEERNVAKLEARYPEGFSTENSINRKV